MTSIGMEIDIARVTSVLFADGWHGSMTGPSRCSSTSSCSGQEGGNLAQLFHEWKTRHHPVILASIIAAAVVNLAVFSAEAIAFLDALGHLEENTDGNTGLAISCRWGALSGSASPRWSRM
jgi:hypothetical protein